MARRFLFFAACFCLFAAIQSAYGAHPPAIHGRGGAVASAAPAATAVGVEVLRAGGNAVDAAVATALALAVVHPNAGNLGGGGFAVVRLGEEVSALDFRETAPAGARHDMFVDGDGEQNELASLVGPLAAGVPGSPAGLFELHRKLGRLPWPRVVAPAVNLARDGWVVTIRLENMINKSEELLSRFDETAAVWLPGGQAPRAGSTVRLPALARTLQAYADQGPQALMEGPLALAVERVSTRHGGVLTADDLKHYQPIWRDPIRLTAFGWEVASMPLPSSGGIIFAQTSGLFERLGWSDFPRFGADRVHVLAESWRRSFADRFLLGDPTTTVADRHHLLASQWLDHRALTVTRETATPSSEVGPADVSSGAESGQTTHLSVVDEEGNVVALTTTLNGNFGCGLMVSETGFFLNNEMDDFAARPGHPNQFGLVQGEANAVGPGKRMLSSMTPIVAWNDEADVIALGAPGGSRIPTATAQVFLNLVVDGDSVQAAVDRPRIHHQWKPDVLYAEEDALSPETRSELEKRGHSIEILESIGLVQIVKRKVDGTVEAVADPRGPGSAAIAEPAREGE